MPVVKPPRADVSALDALAALWRAGGLDDVEARHITVERRFPNFETYWQAWWLGTPRRPDMPTARLPELRDTVRGVLGISEGAAFTLKATASAVKGRAPA